VVQVPPLNASPFPDKRIKESQTSFFLAHIPGTGSSFGPGKNLMRKRGDTVFSGVNVKGNKMATRLLVYSKILQCVVDGMEKPDRKT
jgi:hypothetical protein